MEERRRNNFTAAVPTFVPGGVAEGQVRLVEAQGQEERLAVQGAVLQEGQGEVCVLLVRQLPARNPPRRQGAARVVVQLAVRAWTDLAQPQTVQ